jgi:ribosomal protein S18 acetylase RimI-like enzyme
MNFGDLGEIHPMEVIASPTPWSKNMFVQEIQSPFSHCFTMKSIRIGTSRNGCRTDTVVPTPDHGTKELPENRIIGFICFRSVAGESELLNICVHSQYRQLGIGRMLMEFYIGFCNRMDVRVFYLEVNSSNHSAIHLYQSLSYHFYGIRKRFYQDRFDALLMVKKM